MSVPMTLEASQILSPKFSSRFGGYFVVFQVERCCYALPLLNVERALRMSAVTPVPDFPAWMPGVIDLHGEIIPVVDIGQRFGLPPRPIHPAARLLIVRTNDQTLALIADEVSEIVELAAQKIPLPSDIQKNLQLLAGIIRWEAQLILVLNANHIMDSLPENLNLEILAELLPIQPADFLPPAADDLTQIQGIGQVYARRLKESGIQTYADLARLDVAALEIALGGTRGRRPDLESWLIQAREFTVQPE